MKSVIILLYGMSHFLLILGLRVKTYKKFNWLLTSQKEYSVSY